MAEDDLATQVLDLTRNVPYRLSVLVDLVRIAGGNPVGSLHGSGKQAGKVVEGGGRTGLSSRLAVRRLTRVAVLKPVRQVEG